MPICCRASGRIDFGRPPAVRLAMRLAMRLAVRLAMRPAALPAALAVTSLAGCSGGAAAQATAFHPGLAALALLLVAGLAYALGRAHRQLKTPQQQHPQPGQRPTPGDPGAAGAPHAGVHAVFADPLPALAAAGPRALVESPLVAALLGAQSGAAVLVMADDSGAWQVPLANAAARALWPRLNWPARLDEVAAHLPPPAAAATQAACAAGGKASAAGGWLVEPFGTTEVSAARGLLLVQQAGGGEAGHASEGDNFSFTASHDLRAPIRVVEGFTRIVKEDYGHLLDRVGNDHLDRVLGAAARMNLMIDALLTLARLSQQPLARQPVNLSQLAGYIVDDLRRGEPGREADIEIEPDLSAMGDPTLLRLVLENLLGNAWKYSARAARSHISLHAVAHAGGVAYVVRDNGAGFDMRSADRLFGLFQRLHSASEFPGHGVGLASVRRIINRHGGEIWAEAEPGRGAAFHFTLAA